VPPENDASGTGVCSSTALSNGALEVDLSSSWSDPEKLWMLSGGSDVTEAVD